MPVIVSTMLLICADLTASWPIVSRVWEATLVTARAAAVASAAAVAPFSAALRTRVVASAARAALSALARTASETSSERCWADLMARTWRSAPSASTVSDSATSVVALLVSAVDAAISLDALATAAAVRVIVRTSSAT